MSAGAPCRKKTGQGAGDNHHAEDGEVAPGTVPLDPNGLLSLGVEDDAEVQLRPLYTPVVKYRAAPVS